MEVSHTNNHIKRTFGVGHFDQQEMFRLSQTVFNDPNDIVLMQGSIEFL